MKRINFISGLIVCIFLSSCSDLLEVEAENAIIGNIYDNDENIQLALTGAYYNLGGIAGGIDGGELLGGDFMIIPMLLSHQNSTEVIWRAELGAIDYENFINKDIIATNIRVESNWRRAYETINIVNSIIANIDNVSNPDEASRIEAEARAIRGIIYFEMVRLWGPQYTSGTASSLAVPLVTTPMNSIDELITPTRATVQAVYQQVEADLTSAATTLQPLGKNGTNISYFVCQAYLARIAMQKAEFDLAEDYATNVINSGQFSLEPTPLEAFNNPSNSSEDIFAIQQTLANNTGDRSSGTGITTYYSSLTESGLGNLGLTPFYLSNDLNNSPVFGDNDLRGTVDNTATTSTTSSQINTSFYTNTLNPVLLSPAKYKRVDNVLPVIRLAEMYLTRAEAIFEQNTTVIDNGALSDLNTIRTRAGLPALNAGDFGDSFEFYDSLVQERKRELFLEGHLLHDLRRWRAFTGDTGVTIGFSKDPLDPELILPIPQTEKDASGLD